MEKFEEARNRIIEQNTDSQTLIGMQQTVRRLLSVMYYYEKPMTLNDMMELLDMSKASMSIAVRELEEMGLVKKVSQKAQRRDLYQVEDDNYESFLKYYGYHWRKIIDRKTVSFHESILELTELLDQESLDDETTSKAEKDLAKLHAGLGYFEWLNRLIETFETEEIFDFIPKKDGFTQTGKDAK
ncbi:MarR family transcriptional regulator [uncultured Planococcus sp.]|uniref:GbsR/MarR family transcriptional regulator n=1 Tax=uncultured Planococcus sp. TaxID=337815 RepID=UPI002626D883|nr:MarR family transcriptional regulator [uncultured Planococcus sp.]